MKLRTLYTAIYLFAIFPFHIFSQDLNIDSLQRELEIVSIDTSKVLILNKLSEAYRYDNHFTISVEFAEEAKVLAKEIDHKKGLADSYNNLGISLDFLGEYYLALNNYSKALDIRKELGDKQGIAACHNNIGIIYNRQDNYPKALENYTEALKMYMELDHPRGKAACYTNIGHIHFDKSKPNYDKALENYQNALEIYEEIGYRRGVRYAYNNIGAIYGRNGDTKAMMENYQKGLEIAKEMDDKNGIASYNINVGDIYRDLEDYSNALKHYHIALEISEEIQSKDEIGICYLEIGKTYLHMNDHLESKEWLKKALDIYLVMGNKTQIKNTYEHLSKTDSALGNLADALDSYKAFKLYNDSIFNEENIEELTRADMQFEFDKRIFADSLKQLEKNQVLQAKLDKQKAYTWSGIGITGLLVIFSIFVFRSNKKLTFERQKSDDLLLNILPEEVSEELKEKGTTTANLYDNVTVLFTDFVGFTSKSEIMDTQMLVDELHHCFKGFDEIISKYNIEKIKTIGDSYMAVSGLPQPAENHAQNIVSAAIEIRDFMVQRRKEKGEDTFDIKIGVNSGSVIAGVVGVKKFAYDIWGDTVNTAARMESCSETNKVNISPSTYELVKNDFKLENRGLIEVKDKGELELYFAEFK